MGYHGTSLFLDPPTGGPVAIASPDEWMTNSLISDSLLLYEVRGGLCQLSVNVFWPLNIDSWAIFTFTLGKLMNLHDVCPVTSNVT